MFGEWLVGLHGQVQGCKVEAEVLKKEKAKSFGGTFADFFYLSVSYNPAFTTYNFLK